MTAQEGRRQFNAYLASDLVRAVKRAAVDRGQTLSDFVADALQTQLQGPAPRGFRTAAELRPMPILFVRDMRAALKFWRVFGMRLVARSRNGRWAELERAHSCMALHLAEEDEQRMELTFDSAGPLEPLAERLRSAGFTVENIVDEGYGRSIQVHEPNGLMVQVNEHDEDLYL